MNSPTSVLESHVNRIIKALKGLLRHDIDDLIDQVDDFSEFAEELRSASWRLTNAELHFLERVMHLKDGLNDDGAFIESVEDATIFTMSWFLTCLIRPGI
jgi:hypothetical protein